VEFCCLHGVVEMKVDYKVRDWVLESTIMVNVVGLIWDPGGGVVGLETGRGGWCACYYF